MLEKDINLNIALYLQEYLIGEGIQVIMTRTTDTGLYSEDASNKKAEDMKNRVALIGENDADLLVSIHQTAIRRSSTPAPRCFTIQAPGRTAPGLLCPGKPDQRG